MLKILIFNFFLLDVSKSSRKGNRHNNSWLYTFATRSTHSLESFLTKVLIDIYKYYRKAKLISSYKNVFGLFHFTFFILHTYIRYNIFRTLSCSFFQLPEILFFMSVALTEYYKKKDFF